jgi:hypothetical protein
VIGDDYKDNFQKFSTSTDDVVSAYTLPIYSFYLENFKRYAIAANRLKQNYQTALD